MTRDTAYKTLLLMLLHTPVAVYAGDYRFIFIGDTSSNEFAGLSQGIDEANLQGQFLGHKYTVDTAGPADNPAAGALAVLVAVKDSEALLQIAQKFPDHPVFNLSVMANSLRTDCHDNLLHIIPSEKMYEDARRQWLQKSPGDNIRVLAWHEDFVKFAARDLNKRFIKGYNKPMDELAWAGWAAVKMTSDSIVREDFAGPGELLRYLKTRLSFDGQKGIDMNFRETGQLRQILLIVNTDNRILGEAPVRGVANPADTDSLGFTGCK